LTVIAGTDLDDGGVVVAARLSDLVSQPLAFQFALLDQGLIICDFFVFNKTAQIE